MHQQNIEIAVKSAFFFTDRCIDKEKTIGERDSQQLQLKRYHNIYVYRQREKQAGFSSLCSKLSFALLHYAKECNFR